MHPSPSLKGRPARMPSDSEQRESDIRLRSHQHHEAHSNYVVNRGAAVEESGLSPQEGAIHGGIDGLSLDDIEAAQVLESIRAGGLQLPHSLPCN